MMLPYDKPTGVPLSSGANWFEYFIDCDCRNDKIGRLLKGTGKEEALGHSAKYSSQPEESTMFIIYRVLTTVVSIPLRKPFISKMALRGIISILLP